MSRIGTVSDPEKEPAAVHPKEKQPEDEQDGRAVEQSLIGGAKQLEGVRAEMGRERFSDEAVK